jgi:hypothetical protein
VTAASPSVYTSRMRVVLLISAMVGLSARADNACETKCNQQTSECMKVCTGDPKDAAKPDQGKRLVQCVSSCQQVSKQCKQACGRKP